MTLKLWRHITLLLLLGLLPFTAHGQLPELINDSEFRPDAKAAVESIYNFNFAAADSLMSPWKQKYPQHPLWKLFDGMHFWWQVLSDLEDTSHDEQFFNLMKEADYEAGRLLHRQPKHVDALLIRAISNGYLARQYANRTEWLTSINYGRKAMNAHQQLREQRPELNDLKLAEGLKRYYLAYLPEAYPIVKTVTWALPDGNKQEGLEMIRDASEEAVFASAEATYFLGNINYNYENNAAAALTHFEELHAQYPNNNYYARLLAKSYFKQSRYKKGLTFIDETLAEWKRKDLPHRAVIQEELWTWKGRIMEKLGNNQQALKYYRQAFAKSENLPNTSQRSFYILSGYMAGKLLYEGERFAEAKEYLKKVANADGDSGYREYARDLLSRMS
jgi:tetratricopeptide (TPR) repeat protein